MKKRQLPYLNLNLKLANIFVYGKNNCPNIRIGEFYSIIQINQNFPEISNHNLNLNSVLVYSFGLCVQEMSSFQKDKEMVKI